MPSLQSFVQSRPVHMSDLKHISIRGAREHNLKGIDLDLPRNSLIVMTGLSGSGKSSLAFDTIYADGQRRYVESLSSYARMFLGRMDKPDVDEITDSMDRAITETERRRAIQMAYNKEHGIVPKTIVKAIPDSIEISDKAENAKMNTRRMGKLEREAAIDRLTREMKEAAKLLEFEHAAFLRDQIDRLRRGENPTADSSAEQERKRNHAQTQRRGRKYLGKR